MIDDAVWMDMQRLMSFIYFLEIPQEEQTNSIEFQVSLFRFYFLHRSPGTCSNQSHI